MPRPSQDARLPTWAIQLFGLVIVAAMAIYGMATGSKEILLALIPFAAGCIGISVFERARREVEKALAPPEEEAKREP